MAEFAPEYDVKMKSDLGETTKDDSEKMGGEILKTGISESRDTTEHVSKDKTMQMSGTGNTESSERNTKPVEILKSKEVISNDGQTTMESGSKHGVQEEHLKTAVSQTCDATTFNAIPEKTSDGERNTLQSTKQGDWEIVDEHSHLEVEERNDLEKEREKCIQLENKLKELGKLDKAEEEIAKLKQNLRDLNNNLEEEKKIRQFYEHQLRYKDYELQREKKHRESVNVHSHLEVEEKQQKVMNDFEKEREKCIQLENKLKKLGKLDKAKEEIAKLKQNLHKLNINLEEERNTRQSYEHQLVHMIDQLQNKEYELQREQKKRESVEKTYKDFTMKNSENCQLRIQQYKNLIQDLQTLQQREEMHLHENVEQQKKQPQRAKQPEATSALSVVYCSRTNAYLTKFTEFVSERKTSVTELIQRSDAFPITFPVIAVRCAELLRRPDVTKEKLGKYINSAYPLVHEAVLHLYMNFLEHKKHNGTDKERDLYANMELAEFVQRLLHKRAVVFCGKPDNYFLITGEEGRGNWESVGQCDEEPPLVLASCLSYDEIKLSAFLSVSSHSFFINDGSRGNRGVPGNCDFQTDGVIVGLVGSRLEKPNVMDWQELVVSPEQNTAENGYGNESKSESHHWRRLWANFYGLPSNLPLHEDALTSSNSGRYTSLARKMLFDNDTYKKRVALSAETLLLEAESRAAASGTTAYVNVIGAGLGVWRVSAHQDALFLESFIDCIKGLAPVLRHVSDVHFLWVKVEGFDKTDDVIKREDGSVIRIRFSNDVPQQQLVGKDAGKLLVACYAWDGNSLPGNEFWKGHLVESGDPAAACSTQIAELHNSHINKEKVQGSNLHVATTQWGVLHISEYAQKKRLA